MLRDRFPRTLPSLAAALLSAAALAGCEGTDRPAVVNAAVVDPAGHPIPGAVARIGLVTDTAVRAEAVSDSAGRVRLALPAAGVGAVTFAAGPDADARERVRAPLLLAPGEVELRVRIGGDTGGVEFPDDGGRGARWGRAVALRDVIERRYLAAYVDWMRGDQQEELDPGVLPLIDSLSALLREERDPEVRAALWVTRLWAGHTGAKMPSDSAGILLREVDPGASVWAWSAAEAPRLIRYASHLAAPADAAAEGEDRTDRADRRAAEYLERVIEAHADPRVRPVLLLNALRLSSTYGQRDATTRYYERIMEEFPHTEQAELAAHLAPDRRLWVGRPVPDVALPALDPTDPPLTPADLAGPATLLDFWAVWCGPCIVELPELREVHHRFADRGLRIVSVSFDDSRETVRDFLEREPMPWEHAFADEGWGTRGPIAAAYNVRGIPHKVLVGPDGRILALADELRLDDLETTLERVLGPADAPR